MKVFKSCKALAVVCAASLVGLTSAIAPGLADDENLREGFPGRRVGGGVRNPEACLTSQEPLVALMPETNMALTTEASPTLWFYVPERASGKMLEIRLYNQSNELVYNSIIPDDDSSGIVGVEVSKEDTSQELAVGENYQWRLSIICNPRLRAQDIYVQGWVRRVNLDATIEAQIEQTDPAELPMAYQEAGLWNNALTVLSELSDAPHNDLAIASQWRQLLEVSGLERFVELNQLPEYPVEVFSVSEVSE